MANHAYIKLVSGASLQEITLEEVRNGLTHYRENVEKTAQQLGWHYEKAAFPYEFAETHEGKGKWFYLRAIDPDYRSIVFAVDHDESDTRETSAKPAYLQVTLPNNATHADKGKANEFCKYLASKWKAELHLFNGRIMCYYDRKA